MRLPRRLPAGRLLLKTGLAALAVDRDLAATLVCLAGAGAFTRIDFHAAAQPETP